MLIISDWKYFNYTKAAKWKKKKKHATKVWTSFLVNNWNAIWIGRALKLYTVDAYIEWMILQCFESVGPSQYGPYKGHV